jgi:hypothetical protein
VCGFSCAIFVSFLVLAVSYFHWARCLFLCAALCIPLLPLPLHTLNLPCFCVLPSLHAACACVFSHDLKMFQTLSTLS